MTDQQIETYAIAIHALDRAPIFGLDDRLDRISDNPMDINFWDWTIIIENTRACIRNIPYHRAPKGNIYQRIADRVVEITNIKNLT